MPQGAEPAQDSGDEPANQRAVTVGEGRETGMSLFAVELLVELPLLAQHAVKNIGGNSPRGEAWNVLLGGDARARHQ